MHLLVLFSSSGEVEGNLLTTAVIYSLVKKLSQYFLGVGEFSEQEMSLRKQQGK